MQKCKIDKIAKEQEQQQKKRSRIRVHHGLKKLKSMNHFKL